MPWHYVPLVAQVVITLHGYYRGKETCKDKSQQKMAEHTKGFILRQLGHLGSQDPPFSVLSSRRVWLNRDKHAANDQ